MARQRIHQWASEWGVQSKEILERLEKMGVTGKKSQSVLEDSDALRVRREMGLVGSGVAASKGATVTPTSLKSGVVIRRSRRRPAGSREGAGTVGAYRPLVGRGSPLVATAVQLTPAALMGFDAHDFAYATYTPVVAPTETESEPPSETPAPEVKEEAAATETAAVKAKGAAHDEPVAGAEAEAAAGEVAGEAATPEATAAAPETEAETAPVVGEEAAPVESVVPQAVEEVAPEPEGEPEESPILEEYPHRLSADVAEQITHELLNAAESAEREAEEAAAAALDAAQVSPEAEDGEDASSDDASKPAGPRILGRIDLKKRVAPVLPAGQAETRTTKDGPADKDKDKESERGRKRKRKVVRKDEMQDSLERSFRLRPRKRRAAPGQKVHKTEVTVPKASKRVIKFNEVITPGELARQMGVKVGEIMGQLMSLGLMKSINDAMDLDTTTLIADEFGYTVENTTIDVDQLLNIGEIEGGPIEGEGVARPPIVTVMGHVDHGKTSVLDAIRDANVVSSEAGGITQHIGAYLVATPKGSVCFLDTPGHAAFTSMRARGASVTDVVILVVAADDGVMPQTVEGVNHAKAAGIPVIVAVNKIDKPDANSDRIKQQLSELGLQPEDWGGDTQYVECSALENRGIDELLDAVILQAEFLELTAVSDGRAQGTVVEARLDKGRGPVATVLVQQGTLTAGESFVCGEVTGRVRAMTDHRRKPIKSAGPATPVEIIGLDGVPAAGDSFVVVDDAARAAQVAEYRRDGARKQALANSTRMSLEDLQRQVSAGGVEELKIVIKADVDGSVEAIRHALEKLSNAEVTLKVIHGGVGAINESDVQLAMASQAIVAGFQVRPEAKARQMAEREGVDVRLHSVIYELIDEVKLALEGLLSPDFVEVAEARVEVRDTFSIPGGTIAGCYVTEGTVKRGHDCRLLRDNMVVHTGKIGSLRRFKDDAREVATGYECGIGLERYNDIKAGDVIECFRMDEVRRTLESAAAEAPPAASPASE